MAQRRRGFFSDWRRLAAAVAAGALLLGGGLILLLKLTEPKAPEEAPRNPVATISMSSGAKMRFELYPDQAPNTVSNFIRLANRGFYDGLQFFRIVAGVFIQGGDPKNDGTGDPGYTIAGEFSQNGVKNDVSHMRGTISKIGRAHV